MKASFVGVRKWTNIAPIFLVLVAFAVQMWGLDRRILYGDEVGSLANAQDLASNLQAISYFVLLAGWQRLGISEFWLRAPSALMMTAAAAVAYRAVRVLVSRRVAIAAAALMATSPFLVVYGQQIRFYSLFLLALCISLWAFAECVTKPSRPKFFWLALANLFLLTTHALSLLLIAFEALAVALWSGWPSRGGRRLWLGILCGIAALVLLLFMFRETAFSWFAAYTDSTATYTGSRGLSVTQFAKIPLTLFFFMVGTSIYPLD